MPDEKKLLGDVVEKAIHDAGEAVGVEVKPCAGCQGRKEGINKAHSFTRRAFARGFGAGVGLLAFAAKNEVVKAAWKAAGAPMPITLMDAWALVGMSNVAQHISFARNGKYFEKDELLADVDAANRQYLAHDPKHSANNWASQLAPAAKEPLPGWTMDVHVGKDGYTIVLTGPDAVLITDQSGLISHASAIANAPKARDIRSGLDFPGAVNIGRVVSKHPEATELTWWERTKAFLTPHNVVYAAQCCGSPCSCSGYNCPWHYIGGNCGVCGCINTCCQTYNCSSAHCASDCCFGNPGVDCSALGFTCTWYNSQCNNIQCGQCMYLIGQFCRSASPCTYMGCAR